ncbi:MAG: PIN domain-containing protein [Helicobacteraceae bacterium]|nr:PIN domain-containing protein [Helicobacteraceae bacterium]
MTTIYYLINKNIEKSKADEIIEQLLQLFNIADVNKNILIKALKNNGKDFEDSVIYTSAEYFNIDVIITRDKKGFKQSNIKVLKPNDFLEEYKL